MHNVHGNSLADAAMLGLQTRDKAAAAAKVACVSEQKRRLAGWLMLGSMLGLAVAARAQDPATPPPAQQPAVPAAAPAPASPADPADASLPSQQAAGATAPKPVTPARKGKAVYTGPTEVIELPPTPMLDEEGKQRIDPDGKPMFNPPVKQQRDKYGHPLFDANGKPVFQTATDLGYDQNGHKIHEKKEKPPKTISVSISRGTLTVDGMIGKAALNYDIADLKYIYLYAPWIGTVVVSNAPFPGAKEQPNAFDKNTLTVTVDDHSFQVYSEKLLLGKKPEPAYVAVNRDFKLPAQAPVMGYGATLKAPYAWPGAKQNPNTKTAANAPPVPANLRPALLLPPCPAGQMRGVERVVLPGETAPPPPCVPIATATSGSPAAAPAPASASAPPSSTSPPQL